ncbi:MAG: hypothetical protein ABI459_04970 [Deltaproteobacteria bacterium]
MTKWGGGTKVQEDSVDDFIRPDVKRFVMQNRELIGGLVISLLGIVLAATNAGFWQVLGLTFAVAGAVLLFTGIQRARFRNDAGGPGIVQVDEALITYFGPIEGGSVSIQNLARIELEPDSKPLHWALSEPGQAPLNIPVNAEGANALFDAFTALPGIDTENMLALLNGKLAKRTTVWQRTNTPVLQLRDLH